MSALPQVVPPSASEPLLTVRGVKTYYGAIPALRGVDIDVHDPPVLGELAEFSGHPIVEPHTQGEQEVGLIHGVVGIDGAVHAQHVERKIVVAGNRTQAVHRHGHGNARLGGELAELFLGVGGQDPAAAVDDRLLAARNRGEDLADLLR